MPAIRLVFLLLGAAFGTLFPFTAVILAARGFDAAGIGLVTAASAVAYTASVPFWGHLGDVVLGRRRALAAGAIGAAAALAVFGLPIPAVAIGLAYVAFTLAESGTAPIADALAMNAMPAGRSGGYGRVRLFTSLSYALVSIAAGLAFDRTGYAPAPFAGAVIFVLLAIVARFVPDRPVVRLPVADRRRGGSVRAAFGIAPRLPAVLLAIFLASFGAVTSFTFLPLRIQELGGAPSAIALAAGLSAAVEVPGYLLAGWLVGRIGLRALFAASAILYAVCLASYAFFASPGPIIAARVVSGFGWAGVTLSAAVAMTLLLPPALQATGQGLTATTTVGLGTLAAGLAGGLMYGTVGPDALFLVVALAALVAVAVGWAVLPGRVRVRLGGGGRGRPAADGRAMVRAPDEGVRADGGLGARTAPGPPGPAATMAPDAWRDRA